MKLNPLKRWKHKDEEKISQKNGGGNFTPTKITKEYGVSEAAERIKKIMKETTQERTAKYVANGYRQLNRKVLIEHYKLINDFIADLYNKETLKTTKVGARQRRSLLTLQTGSLVVECSIDSNYNNSKKTTESAVKQNPQKE